MFIFGYLGLSLTWGEISDTLDRMKVLTLFLMFLGVMAMPLLAQDEAVEMDTFAETTESADVGAAADEEEDSEKKSKKKKKKKAKKGSKFKKNSKEDDAEMADKGEPAESAVVTAFSKFKNIGGKLNKKADYYIYFATSSTCVHCQRCMPVVIEQYKKMKFRKVELIVIDADNSEESAKKYLKSYKMKNPAMLFSALQATQFRGLPGCGLLLPPTVCVVSKDGTQIKNAVGAQQVIDTINDWKALFSGK